ncbi:MAG: FG-GAP repeat domain-containing protein, partial [Bryobacteraceae bacterium]
MSLRGLALLLVGFAAAHAAPIAMQEWTAGFGEAMLTPVPYPDAEHTSAVVLTATSGRIRLIGPDGHVLSTMQLTLPATASAIPVAFERGSEPVIVAADVAGSIYCFRRDGRLKWKYAQDGKATDFRHLTAGDISGDGKPEVILTGSRGHLFAVDGEGRLKLEIRTTTFRLSTAATADLDGDGRPELVFGTEDNEVYAVRGDGRMLWHTEVPGRVGRALPVIAELRPGEPDVLV